MNQVRALREAAGLSQRELANLSGVAQPNIAACESDRRVPSPKMLDRLQAAARPRPSTVVRQRREEILSIAARHRARDVRVFGSDAALRGQGVQGGLQPRHPCVDRRSRPLSEQPCRRSRRPTGRGARAGA